ncbi:MAG: hypothetical protein KDB07_09950 [Planctomycetes bacterium]|nr:hypothetical protein [Planctomycetota bacterium]
MREIELQEVKEGQTLARPVTDGAGKRLVERGVEVTNTLIRVLQRRGVEKVFIDEDAKNTLNPDEDPIVVANRAEMSERLVIGFQHHVDNPTMALLYKAAHDYLSMKILREAGH